MATKPWGAEHFYAGPIGPTLSEIQTVEGLAGRHLDYVGFTQNFAGSTSAFATSIYQTIISYGATPVLAWSTTGDTLAYINTNITNGSYDSIINSYITGIQSLAPSIVICRLNHEANGNWYPWSPGLNGNTFATYIAAWQYIVGKFQLAGVTNIKWSFCMATEYAGETTTYANIYPGDSYVDYVALDIYNWGEVSPHTWRTFSQAANPSIDDIKACSTSGKPFYVQELGTVAPTLRPDIYNRQTWILDAMEQIESDSRINFWLYFDGVGSQGDYTIYAGTPYQLAFKSGLVSTTSFNKF